MSTRARVARSSNPLVGCVVATLCTLLAWHAELLSAQSSDADHRPQQCVSGPVAWMQRALDTWALVSRNSLELRPDSLPWIILYDARCAWHLSPRGAPAESSHDMTGRVALRFAGAPVTVYAFEHGDTLHLPSGQVLPATQPAAFTSLYRGDSASFFVMALPERWNRNEAEASDPERDEFFLAVLAHEMMHTVHLAAVARHVEEIGKRWKLPEGLNDDIVQQTFDSVPAFRESVELERNLLARAAMATDDESRRSLTRQALEFADARRQRYFTGANAVYAPLEDVFLLMEGLGSWVAYRVWLAHARPGTSAVELLAHLLDEGDYWSQEIGLSMMVVIDAMLPGWRERVFDEPPPSIYSMLAEAAGVDPGGFR